MAKPRIATKPTALRDQLVLAVAGIQGETNWPTTAPTELDVNGAEAGMSQSITSVENLKAQLAQARATLHANTAHSMDLMKRIDEVTDGLYGSDSTLKENFGLPPKKSTHGEHIPLGQVLIIKIEAGTAPASIYVDWDPDAGAKAYEMEWYTDAAMAQRVGNVSITITEYEIHGLVVGQQYWVRVRSLSGSENGQWSDPATFMANL